jgi:uncharacterized protein
MDGYLDGHEIVRRRRIAAGVTQADLARQAGVSRPNLVAIESGARAASPERIDQFLVALGITPRELVAKHRDEVLEICAAHHLTDVRVFGSVARGDDTIDSDLDLVVISRDHSLYDMAGAILDLTWLLGVDVDVVSLGGADPITTAEVLREAIDVRHVA